MKTCLNNAFSLLELLVGIAILAVLLLLGSGVVSRATQSLDKMRCTSNLQQVSKAIHLYTVENNGVLPGPLQGRQRVYTTPYHHGKRPGVGSNRQVCLIDRIAPYIGLRIPSGNAYTPYVSDLFVCPAGRKQMAGKIEPESAKYYSTTVDPVVQPFGYYSSRGERPPLSLRNIPKPAEVMAMADHDSVLQFDPDIPLTPSHHNSRNVLYLDGHVEALPLDRFE